MKQTTTKQTIDLRGLFIPTFSEGDYLNMQRTLKEHPEINTGDWYEKIRFILKSHNQQL